MLEEVEDIDVLVRTMIRREEDEAFYVELYGYLYVCVQM